MKLEFGCPTCSKRLIVDGSLAGQSRSCPKCQVVLTIPNLPEPAYESVDEEPPTKLRAKPKRPVVMEKEQPPEPWFQRHRSSLIVGGLSTLAVVAIVVILLLIVQKTKDVNATPEEIAAKAQKAKAEQLEEKRAAVIAELDRENRGRAVKEGSQTFLGWILFGLIILAWIAVALSYIFLPIIMYRDSVVRGMPHGVAWVALGLATWFVAFIIYIFARPQSRVVRCGYCGNRSLWYKTACVHCESDIEQPA